MSARLLMNIGMGSVAILLAVSVGTVFTSLGDREADQARVDLAGSQQALVQEIAGGVESLNAAANLMEVGRAREDLGASILQFDRNLNALLHGGAIADASGHEIEIPAPASETTRSILEETAELWVQTGLPLADLAAGEFSIFSSAGQAAVAGLQDNGATLMTRLSEAATAMGEAASTRQARGQAARWLSLGLTATFLGLGLMRFKPGTGKRGAPQASTPPSTNAPRPAAGAEESRDDLEPGAPPAQAPTPPAERIWDRPAGQTFVSPVDFDNVNASVDQLSVDMNTIATSTGKMQLAIDSVGHAMQGMLFSLNQMAQDTAEGYKIVRGANNAATYTGSAAGELAQSALEMSRVVGRVTQLAMKTKQVAAQIEAEAVATGRTGEAFTSVVAGEVQGLAHQTSQATAQIEQTVAEILGTARQYEEAIGQILKNIGAIHKVSENLGEMMLHPPAAGVAGTPLPGVQTVPLAPQAPVAQAAPAPAPAPAPAAAPAPAPDPAAAAPPEPAPQAATPEPEPEQAPAPEAEAEKPAAPEPEPVDDWGGVPDDPAPPEPSAEDTAEAIEESASEEAPAGSNGNVFMLGGGAKKPRPKKAQASKPEPQPAPATEPEAEAEKPAEPEPEAEDEGGGSNIFMLNKPKKAPAAPKAEAPAEEPPASEPEPAPEPEAEKPAAPEPEAEEEDSGTNIFMLNKPKKAPAAPKAEAPAEEPPASEPETAPEPEAEIEEPVTVPADEKDSDAKSGKGGGAGSDGNIFMLNKPKK